MSQPEKSKMAPTSFLPSVPNVPQRKLESAITPFFLLAVQIYIATYGKIPPVFLDLTIINNATLLIRVHPMRKSKFQFFWTISLVFGASVGATALIAILLKKLFNPQDSQLDLLEIAICILCVACFFLSYAWLCSFIEHRNKIPLCNDFMNNGLRLGVPIKNSSYDISGILMVAMAICMILLLLPAPYIIVLLNLDPVYILAREIMMPPLVDWNLYHIFSLYILSFLICPLACFLMFKYVFVFAFLFVVLTDHIKNYALTLFRIEMPNELVFLKWFTVCRIFVGIGQGPLSQLLMCLVLWTQVILTIAAWVIVRCFFILPILISVTAIAGFIGGIMTSIYLFRTLVRARVYSAEIVKKKRSQFHSFDRSTHNYYLTTMWRARQEFPIRCGHQFSMSYEAINNYLSILNGNVSNAVLLVRP